MKYTHNTVLIHSLFRFSTGSVPAYPTSALFFRQFFLSSLLTCEQGGDSNREMIRRAFEKCGISVPIDGSKDELINIRGLTNYTVDPVQEEGLFELDSDSD